MIVHPQRWPEDLDLAGKRVVVIGSGATAATLIPAIAGKAEHVTMLQRSPSYFYAPPATHELAVTLRALDIPEEWTHEILRRQYISQQNWLARTSRELGRLKDGRRLLFLGKSEREPAEISCAGYGPPPGVSPGRLILHAP